MRDARNSLYTTHMPIRATIFATILIAFLALCPMSFAQTQDTRASTQKPVALLGAYGTPDDVKLGPLHVNGTNLTYVKPGGAADKCGLRPHDIVVKINRQPTPDPEALNSALTRFHNVSKVVEYFRHNGKRYDIKTTMINEGRHWTPPKSTRNSQLNAQRLPQHEMEAYMLLLVNSDRAKTGAGVLAKSNGLSRMARNYADDMAKRDFKGHKDPEGRDPWARAKLAGINTIRIRENCAYPSPQPDGMAMVREGEADLMESPHHKVNILAPDNACVGIGIAYRKDGGLMVVQVFSSEDVP